MPYHIESSTGEYKIVDDAGKIHGTHPTRKQAVAQLQALYANVPDANKEIDETEKASKDPGDYLIVEDREMPTTWHLQVRKNGTPDHGLMGAAWAALHEGYRGNAYEGPNKGEALSKLKKLYESEKMDTPATKEAQEPQPQPSIIDRVIAALKGDAPGHPFRGNQFGAGDGGDLSSMSHEERRQKMIEEAAPIFDKQRAIRKQMINNIGGLEGSSSDWQKARGNRRNKKLVQEHDTLTNEINALEDKWTPGGKELSNLKVSPRFSGESIWDAVISNMGLNIVEEELLLKELKEGRRNSSPDGDRLQQIHDLAVLNGASCPMVMKEADGKLRWVLLSSNAFMDSDKEIISRKALEDDVARTDKEQAPYGPLRWWHMGAPDPIGLHAGSGADIGDCDYRAMSGRVLIESGTFRNERIGEAIKERADSLAGSIGFFHPKDEPDNEGVYRNIVQFERSLLPRGKASNMLTALTVKGWEDMATSKEKQDALAALLGDQSLAESVIKQAEIVEKQADDKGLKYKEQVVTEKAPSGTPTAVPATGASGINPIGLEDEKKAKKAEGEPGEEKTEPKAEAQAEPDWEALMKGLGPHISKMIEEKMKANAKEASEKEAGLKTQLDQIANDVKELKGDIPRGLQGGFRASLSDMTIVPGINTKAAPEINPLDSVIDQLMGLKK